MIFNMAELVMVLQSILGRIYTLHLQAVTSLELNWCQVNNNMQCRNECDNRRLQRHLMRDWNLSVKGEGDRLTRMGFSWVLCHQTPHRFISNTHPSYDIICCSPTTNLKTLNYTDGAFQGLVLKTLKTWQGGTFRHTSCQNIREPVNAWEEDQRGDLGMFLKVGWR